MGAGSGLLSTVTKDAIKAKAATPKKASQTLDPNKALQAMASPRLSLGVEQQCDDCSTTNFL